MRSGHEQRFLPSGEAVLGVAWGLLVVKSQASGFEDLMLKSPNVKKKLRTTLIFIYFGSEPRILRK